jgi:hypothetical protein
VLKIKSEIKGMDNCKQLDKMDKPIIDRYIEPTYPKNDLWGQDEQTRIAYERYRKAGPNWVPNCVKYGYVGGQCDCGRVKEYKGPKCGIGCLDEDTYVLMWDGKKKTLISELKPGDILYKGGVVQKVIRFHIDSIIAMCETGPGVLVTEWHPMRDQENGDWFFPCKKYKTHNIYVNTVCDLILAKSHIIPVIGMDDKMYDFVSMAHGVIEPPILFHSYWGTQAIVKDLRMHPDYHQGYMNIHGCELLYDEDGIVYKMDYDI